MVNFSLVLWPTFLKYMLSDLELMLENVDELKITPTRKIESTYPT